MFWKLYKAKMLLFEMMKVEFKKTQIEDCEQLLRLYKAVAQNPRGIARSEEEINLDYIAGIITSSGLGFVAIHENRIIGEIHATSKNIRIFNHLLSYLTIGIHPDYQGKGLGTKLFNQFLDFVQHNRPDISRVELESRASNKAGIKLYEKMGFVLEGRMKNQTRNADGSHEDGVMYAWFNPNYNQSF